MDQLAAVGESPMSNHIESKHAATVVGFVRDDRANVYTRPDRVEPGT